MGEYGDTSHIHKGVLGLDLPAGPKAGELVRLQGRSVYKFREGMIFELTDYS